MAVAIRLEIDPRSAESLRRLKALSAGGAAELQRDVLRTWAIGMLRRLKENSPGSKPGNTGNFRRAWGAQAIGANGMSIFNRARYAPFVEFDTRAHHIAPRLKQALRWRLAGSSGQPRGPVSAFRASKATAASNFAFARGVNHPGTKGQKVFRRSFEEMAKDLLEQLGAGLRRALAS